MNGNTAEDKIRMKVEPIDTLQAGIVYGKEDAWDRLQARLDARTEPKIIPWYKVTAAAAALLLLTGATYYLVTGNNTRPGVRSGYVGALSNTYSVPFIPSAAVDVAGTLNKDTYSTTRIHTAPIHPLPYRKAPPVVTEAPISPTIPEIEHTPPEMQPPAPPAKMKVVHINDLGQQEDNSAHYAWEERNPFPHVQFRMKVIHINDIGLPLRQEDYMRSAEKAAVWRLPLGHTTQYSTGELPGRLFRINLSTNRNNEKATFYTGPDMDIDSTEPIVY